MATSRFSKKEAIRFGWEAMKNNLVFFVLFVLAAWVVSGGISALGAAPAWGPRIVFFPFVFSIIGWVVSIFISLAVIKIGLRLSAAEGESAYITDIWSGYPLFLNYLVGSILYGLIVIAGLILLIVPGIIWAIKYSMFGYLIIDRELPPVEALKRSAEITRGVKGDLFLLGLLFFGIAILGALACGVGLFAAIPTIWVAYAFVYRKLAYGAAEQAGAVAQTPEAARPPEA